MTDPEAPTYANTIKLELLIADLQAKLAAVEQERDRLKSFFEPYHKTAYQTHCENDQLRTALLALPVAQEALECAAYALSHTESNQAFALDVINVALLRLAQAMRGRQ